jgi:hypothetical protein
MVLVYGVGVQGNCGLRGGGVDCGLSMIRQESIHMAGGIWKKAKRSLLYVISFWVERASLDIGQSQSIF